MRSRWIRTGALGVALALGTLTGCSSGNAATDGTALEGQSAAEIIAGARDAYHAATSVRVAGTMPLDDREVSVDLRLTQGGDVHVAVTSAGLTVETIRVGDQSWFRSPQAWQQVSPAVAQAVGDRWTLIAAGSPGEQLAALNQPFSNKSAFGDELLGSPTKLELVEGETVNGVPTVGLRDTTGITMHIAAEGEPYPLLITPAPDKDQTKRVTFTNYNEDLGIAAPQDAVTDIDSLIASTLAG